MGFSLRTSGFEKVFIELNEAERRSNDLTPAMKRAALVMMKSIDDNFKASGRPARWRRLSKNTLKQKLKQRYSPLALIRTGQLRRSIATAVGGRFMQIGTSVKYAKYHQTGTSNIPRRTFLVFQKEDIDQINQIVSNYIMNKG